MQTWKYSLKGDTLRIEPHWPSKEETRDTSYSETGCLVRIQGGVHYGVEHDRGLDLVLAKTEIEAEGKESSPPADVVCLNENRGNMENGTFSTLDGRD